MKNTNKTIRLVSAGAMAVAFSILTVVRGDSPVMSLSCCVLSACMILSLGRKSYEFPKLRLVLALVSMLFPLLAAVMSRWAVCIVGLQWYLVMIMFILEGLYTVRITSARPGAANFWRTVEGSVSLVLLAFMLSLLCLSRLLAGSVWGWLPFLLSLVLYVLMYRRELTGESLLVPLAREVGVRELLCDEEPAVPPVVDGRMKKMYDEVVALMEQDRLYLNPYLTINMMVTEIGTNKSYLSKVINSCYGENFRQFVNHYRVEHAMALIESDKYLLMRDVSDKSGFRTQATMDACFKLRLGMTPMEYHQKVYTKLTGR